MTSIAKRLIRKSKPQLPIYKDAKGHKTLLELINVYPDYGVGLNVVYLDVDSLNHEKSRLENSIFHLTRSINELKSFINDQNSSDNNFEFELAIKENEEVITNQDQGMDTGEEDGVYL
nr:1938_t:CDS:2 [Entrophospora candida]